jgi:hypothetical protein
VSSRAELLQELYYALAIPTLPRWTKEHEVVFLSALEAHVKALIAELLAELPEAPHG